MQKLLALVAVALLVVAGANAAESSFRETATDSVDVGNESFTPTGGQSTVLAESDRDDLSYNYTDSVEVRANTSDLDSQETHSECSGLPSDETIVINQSGNWTWDTTDGTVFTEANSTLDCFTTAQIDYGGVKGDENQREMLDTIGQLFASGRWLVLVLGVGVLFTVLGVFR